jgi:thioredoxin-dependent peroxiredoxin
MRAAGLFALVAIACTAARPLGVGSAAPDFEAVAHDGTTVRLRALRGRPVVLYFYPKDDTPG